MNTNITIRSETPADVQAIDDITIAAFRTLAVSRHTEQFILAALRAAGALTISLVAQYEGRVVGHVAFSPVTLSDGTPDWYGLGPVSVWPAMQRRGIGKALIQRGLALLKQRAARGCCLVGDPNCYTPLGFRNIQALVHEGVPPEVFLALPLGEAVPRAVVAFHDAFQATARPGEADDAPR